MKGSIDYIFSPEFIFLIVLNYSNYFQYILNFNFNLFYEKFDVDPKIKGLPVWLYVKVKS